MFPAPWLSSCFICWELWSLFLSAWDLAGHLCQHFHTKTCPVNRDFVLDLRPFCCSIPYAHSCCWPGDDLRASSSHPLPWVFLMADQHQRTLLLFSVKSVTCEGSSLEFITSVSYGSKVGWYLITFLVTVTKLLHHVRDSMLVGAACCYGGRVVWQLMVA